MLTRSVASAVIGIVLATVLATPALAAGQGVAATYHGALVGAAFGCDGQPVDGPQVEGVWNLNVQGSAGTVTINVSYDGAHHLSFGYPKGVVTTTATGVEVEFWGTATASVAGEGFSWTTPVGACTPDHPYDTLTYLGVVSH